MSIPTLNIIGCGKVGKTLGRLWHDHGVFKIQNILNQSFESAVKSCQFIGAGNAISQYTDLLPADYILIGTADSQIIEQCQKIVESRSLKVGTIVFHCSGAIPSTELSPLKALGAKIGSVHPIKTFANPALAISNFTGTFCGIEGENEAITPLTSAFETIGGKIFEIDPTKKLFYHAATVITCNYLTALMELGTQTYMQAGIEKERALEIMQPLVLETVKNIFILGTVDALTGPIARGDAKVVAEHLETLKSWKLEYSELYRGLGLIALNLVQSKDESNKEVLSTLVKLLANKML